MQHCTNYYGSTTNARLLFFRRHFSLFDICTVDSFVGDILVGRFDIVTNLGFVVGLGAVARNGELAGPGLVLHLSFDNKRDQISDSIKRRYDE